MGRDIGYGDKVVVLTGATSGIGHAMSLQLAAQGARLILAARDEDRLRETAAACRERGGAAHPVVTDVTSEADCRRLMEECLAREGRLDVLVNNAGMSIWSRVDEMQDLSMLRRIMDVNYFGSAYCTYYALPHLLASGGRIGVIASLTGRLAVPTRAGYAASKIAMTSFHESLRAELNGTDVSVTIMFPDWVATDIRARSLGPDNRPLGHSPAQDSHMMTAERCAEICLRAIARRRRGHILSFRGHLGVFVKQFCPGLVDFIARRAIRKGK